MPHAFAPTVRVKLPGKEGSTAADAIAATRYTDLTHELQRNLEVYGRLRPPSCRLCSGRTGCSAAWLARVLWVLLGVLSNLTAIAFLTWAFDGRGCGILTVR
jgi:hypothetical protein